MKIELYLIFQLIIFLAPAKLENRGSPSPETLLIVGTGTAHENGDVVLDQLGLELQQSLDDTFKGGGHVGKIGNAAANDQHLPQLHGV